MLRKSIIFKNDKIAKYYNLKKKININNISSSDDPKSNTLIYCLNFNIEFEKKILKVNNCVLILKNNIKKINKKIHNKHKIIFAINPRLQFIKILNKFIIEDKKNYKNNLFYKSENSYIHPSVTIEPFVFIDDNVYIERNCLIKSGVKIYSNVSIKSNTVIGSNSVIGHPGFGIDRDNKLKHRRIPLEGNPYKIKHFGGVLIGRNVDIGSLNTIASGVINPTIIEDFVVTDDHVHIGHNCKIRKGVAIAAAAEISGSVDIGRNTWIGPNSSLMQKIKIGKKNIVGINTTVFKDTENNSNYLGVPARKITRISETE
jgi:UDP-3-O-[3-hydroxymyristoyl] glucosamine N-acyltransferase